MCVDYTDLNKACPKDSYPLPNINALVDSASGKLMEVSVDDMLVKTKEDGTLLSDLSEVLSTIRKYEMRLNPSKFTFAIEVGKFSGFMLTQRGIEANSDKCQAILDIFLITR
ncbi:uncharacterized protein [Arachis hypogaea]|uniref:uncharacterized protein n=1 Tax=Arachis hypogaea TaxID=3818 RepID=UPI0007AF2274